MYGVPITGAEIYCTTQPCLICTKMLINCQVRHISFNQGYPDPLAMDMIKEAGIGFEVLEGDYGG